MDVCVGCRHQDDDWLYRTEREELQKEDVITKLHTAFSRDGHKEYVQDIIRGNEECAARLLDLIMGKRACIYVCGDGNAMAKDVQNVIVELLSKQLGGEDQGKEYFAKMKTDKRFLMDIWS